MSYLSKINTSRIFNDAVNSSIIADGSIVDADINVAAAIALSKLATDPLARSNHTGTQTRSTISDFAHATTHSRSGVDPLDGDTLDVDFVPTNYVRTVAGGFSTNVEELASHLKGIDDYIGAGGTFLYTMSGLKTSAYAITGVDQVIRCSTSVAGFTVTLPDATLYPSGKWYVVKDVAGASGTSGKEITVATTGGQTIDGAATDTIDSNYAAVLYVSNGTNWEKL